MRTQARNNRPPPQTGQRLRSPRRTSTPADALTVVTPCVHDGREPWLRATGTLPGVDEADRISELSGLFAFLAETDYAGYSPLYERMARVIAASPPLLAFIDAASATNTRRGRVPVLFMATLHDLALRGVDPALTALFEGAPATDAEIAAVLGDTIEHHRDALVTTMGSRSVQTNEVGRSAAIGAALAGLDTDGRALALVELGPSAGLNLYCDRWHVDWYRDGSPIAGSGPEDSPVRLECELRGPADPPFGGCGPIAVRTGVDTAPIDVTDPDDARWLQACVWPGLTERSERLAAAVAATAHDAPVLVRGDAVDALVPLVAAIDPNLYPVVVSTWAMAYLSAEGRAAIVDGLDRVGAARDLALVTLEEPRFTPWVDAPTSDEPGEGQGTPTLLALRRWHDGHCTSRPLAMCHPHVRWMQWSEEGSR